MPKQTTNNQIMSAFLQHEIYQSIRNKVLIVAHEYSGALPIFSASINLTLRAQVVSYSNHLANAILDAAF